MRAGIVELAALVGQSSSLSNKSIPTSHVTCVHGLLPRIISTASIYLDRLAFLDQQLLDTLCAGAQLAEMNLNLSASLNVFKLLANPSLCLPHATVATFNDLPIPLEKAFEKEGRRKADIRAVILDKDDCFAYPDSNTVFGPYKVNCSSMSSRKRRLIGPRIDSRH